MCLTPEPEEALLAAIIRQAIKDATRHGSEKVRTEAAIFLWMVVPTIAAQAAVPDVKLPADVARLW